MTYSSDDTEGMAQIGGRLLLESGAAEAMCPDCHVALVSTREPDYKRCPRCREKYWVVVGFRLMMRRR